MWKGDLNLLAVFDTLYELRSVTRTAERLNLTQSAVSHALRRLRETVDDPLFVRVGGALQPTLRAHAMATPVREGLGRLGEALTPARFDPATSQRTFAIAASSYFCALLIPELVAMARPEAPGIRIRAVPIRPDLLNQIDDGLVDLALANFSRMPARILSEPLLQEELVWIAAKDNPVVERRHTHAELLDMPHVAYEVVRTFAPVPASRTRSEHSDPLEQELPRELYGSATSPVVVFDTFAAMAVVERSNLIALVPRQLGMIEKARRDIEILDTGQTAPCVQLGMASLVRSSADGALNWLRSHVRQCASILRLDTA
jgi:DNA-binding transcriptional LysR family regulator